MSWSLVNFYIVSSITGATVGGIIAVILIAIIIIILLTVYCIYRRSKGIKQAPQRKILTTQDNVAYDQHTITNEPSNIGSTVVYDIPSVNITDNIAYGHVTHTPPTTTTTTTTVPVYDTVQ